jgi:hypothetical protein
VALLPLYGHRNWIVVGDSAYPGKSKPAIETILSGAGRLEVTRKVLDTVNNGSNVRANVCLDQERQLLRKRIRPTLGAFGIN